jgi:FkbM family methyltransferase
MANFKEALIEYVKDHLYVKYGAENHDSLRYGPFKARESSLIAELIRQSKKAIGYKGNIIATMQVERLAPYLEKLGHFYQLLNDTGKKRLVELIAYRLLGKERVKLFTNTPEYHHAFDIARSLKKGSESLDPHFLHFQLNKFDLRPSGYDVELFFGEMGVAIDFLIEQYAYKENGHPIVQVKPGDVVLDLGGCYGDTALYFATKSGDSGKVYTFEFIPNNVDILRKNLALNPSLEKRVTVVEHPVSDKSDVKVYYQDFGPASHISAEPFEAQTGETTTLTIDDFVDRYQIQKVDFIKMDIEGSEPRALAGAERTIRRFRPVLAVAIYHSMDDFGDIPAWISSLGLPYDYYLGHYTIHAEETILFAKPIQ